VIRFLRQLVVHDFWLKLFSLGLAVVTWFTVAYAIQRRSAPISNITLNTHQLTLYKVPVVVLSSASDVHDFRVDPREVQVTVQGEPGVLEKLQNSDIRPLVDLTGIEGPADLRKRIEVSTPSGVTFVRVFPPDVKVIFPRN
jgi:YbbR domain-containing protein